MSKSEVSFAKPIFLASAIVLLLMISSCASLPLVQGFTQNDPEGNPWHLDAINIHSVWDYGYSFYSPDAVGLCVIGDPVTDDQNGDLNITERASYAWNSEFTSYIPYPSSSTTTHEAAVASVAASAINNSIGVAGIVNAPLYCAWPWGNYPDDDVDFERLYVQQMIDIFDWGTSFGKMVFTMSFIATMYSIESNDPLYVELRNKVSELYESGEALFYAASGNVLFPLHPKDVPQSLPYVRVIGMINSGGTYNDGGYGDQLFLIAPAGGVPAYMQNTGSYGTFGGASCSTPIVAASAVLLWNQFPWATNAQIEDALVWGATDILESGWDEKSGYGALDVERSRVYLAEFIPSANSYRLNWSIIDNTTPATSANTTTSTSTNTISSNWTSLQLYLGISIPIITGLIVLVITFKKRRN